MTSYMNNRDGGESCEVIGILGTKELILGGYGTGHLGQRKWIGKELPDT